MGSLTRYLEHTLKLKVNPAKSKVAQMSECSFLSFTIKGKKIRWTEKSLANFKHRIKELTAEAGACPWRTGCTNWGSTCGVGWATLATLTSASTTDRSPSWTSRSEGLCECATGHSGAGRAPRSRVCWLWAEDCGSKSACADLDSPKGRSSATTRPARLSLKSAIPHGVSSRSYWHMARTAVTQQALNNKWWAAQGLLSVKDLWCKAQSYTQKKTSSCEPAC